MNTYHCEFLGLDQQFGGNRARVNMLEDHLKLGGRKGEVTITSEIRSIDFERKFLVTRNSLYYWGQK